MSRYHHKDMTFLFIFSELKSVWIPALYITGIYVNTNSNVWTKNWQNVLVDMEFKVFYAVIGTKLTYILPSYNTGEGKGKGFAWEEERWTAETVGWTQTCE